MYFVLYMVIFDKYSYINKKDNNYVYLQIGLFFIDFFLKKVDREGTVYKGLIFPRVKRKGRWDRKGKDQPF